MQRSLSQLTRLASGTCSGAPRLKMVATRRGFSTTKVWTEVRKACKPFLIGGTAGAVAGPLVYLAFSDTQKNRDAAMLGTMVGIVASSPMYALGVGWGSRVETASQKKK